MDLQMNFRSLLLISTVGVLLGSYATHAAYDPWPTGAPGSPSAAVLTVQGAASGGSPIPTTTGSGALETGGNLATLASAQGVSGTGISQPSGGSGVLGWLSGIYSRLTGMASAANQTAIESAPGVAQTTAITIQGNSSGISVPVTDVQSAPFQGAIAMTTGVAYAAQRSVGVLVTIAGNVTFEFSDASIVTLPVYVGWQTFPFAAIQIVSSGTTATATYYNLK
jgi:hypothetical protein